MFEYTERLRAAQPRREYGLDGLTGGWFSAIILIVCLPLTLWEIVIKFWRLITAEPALALQSGQLIPHASFLNAPKSIAICAIRAVTIDRSDSIRPDAMRAALTAFSLTNRLAMKWGGDCGIFCWSITLTKTDILKVYG
jgi:hypothetical protein